MQQGVLKGRLPHTICEEDGRICHFKVFLKGCQATVSLKRWVSGSLGHRVDAKVNCGSWQLQFVWNGSGQGLAVKQKLILKLKKQHFSGSSRTDALASFQASKKHNRLHQVEKFNTCRQSPALCCWYWGCLSEWFYNRSVVVTAVAGKPGSEFLLLWIVVCE